MTATDARIDEVPLFIQRFVRLSDDVAVFLVRGQIIDVIGDDAVALSTLR